VLFTELNLANNDLSGEFPDLSSFPQLNVLNLISNANLTGVLSLPADIQDIKVDVLSEDQLPVAVIAISIVFSTLAMVCAALAYSLCSIKGDKELFIKIKVSIIEALMLSYKGGRTRRTGCCCEENYRP
jgi:hypothetical protein